MKRNIVVVCIICAVLTGSLSFHKQSPDVPKVWTDERVQSLFLPLADSSPKMHAPTSAFYYQQAERVIYKSYPLYMPGREPKGYYDWLRQQEPEIAFDANKINSEADYIKAGETIYDAATHFISMDSGFLNHTDFWKTHWEQIGVKTTADGVIPQFSVVVKKKGEILFGSLSCGNCHNKVMPDGSLLKGGQGNFPFDQNNALGFVYDKEVSKLPDSIVEKAFYNLDRRLFAAPWIKHQAYPALDTLNLQEYVAIGNASPAGLMTRHHK